MIQQTKVNFSWSTKADGKTGTVDGAPLMKDMHIMSVCTMFYLFSWEYDLLPSAGTLSDILRHEAAARDCPHELALQVGYLFLPDDPKLRTHRLVKLGIKAHQASSMILFSTPTLNDWGATKKDKASKLCQRVVEALADGVPKDAVDLWDAAGAYAAGYSFTAVHTALEHLMGAKLLIKHQTGLIINYSLNWESA